MIKTKSKDNAYSFHLKILVFCITTLSLAGIVLQNHIYMSHDVAWHVLITQRLLNGGNYTQNFMDISPPIIMYSKIPVIWLMNGLKLSMPDALRLYMFVVSGISLLLCYQVLTILYEKEPIFRNALIIALSFIFFCLPLFELGQRDELAIVLLMPYFFTFAAAPFHTIPIRLRLFSAIFAGIGFLIHAPYFLIFVLFESHLFVFHTKKTARLLERSLIIFFALIYIASIIIYTPDYVSFVLPLVSWLYLDIYNTHWIEMLGSLTALGVYTTLAAFFIITQAKRDFLLNTLACLMLLFFIPYVLTAKLWYYHMLPTLALNLLMLTSLLAHTIKDRNRLAIFLITSLFIFPMLQFTLAADHALATKKSNSPLSQLIEYVQKKQVGGSVYVFSAYMWPQLLTPYANVNIASRFAPTWLPIAIMKKQTTHLSESDAKKLTQIKTYLYKTMTDDLTTYQPNLILVEETSLNSDLNIPIDFIAFFQQDPSFAAIWSHYVAVGHLFHYLIYSKERA